MKILYFLVLSLLVVAESLRAAPAISTATISSNTLSISGSGFGSKSTAAPLKFTNLDSETTGQLPAGWVDQGNGSAVVGTTQAHSGTKSFGTSTSKTVTVNNDEDFSKRAAFDIGELYLQATVEVNPVVRASSTVAGYGCGFNVDSGGNFISTRFYKDGGYLGDGNTGAWSMASDHTIKIVASGTSPVTLTCYVDGVSAGSTTDSSSPYPSGNPGFTLYPVGNYANATIDYWSDN